MDSNGKLKRPEKIELLVFDLDGTLIDSKDDLVHSVNAVRRRMGLEPLPDETVASFVGRGVVMLMKQALGDLANDEVITQAVEFFFEYYREHMLDHTVPYPGVRETLDRLQSRRMAVLTNKPVLFSQAILEGLDLSRYFIRVYGGNSFAQKKPDPIGLFALMQESNVTGDRTMMVGDSETDVLVGRNAGAWTCGVTYGLSPETLSLTPPDFLLDDLRELLPLLNGHSKS
jgi:phosphoglycolate phosphatase